MIRALTVLALAVAAVSQAARGQAVPAPRSAEIDVFVVAGQSNAKGRGDASLSPVPAAGTAYETNENGLVRALQDPVGNANTGSAWPAFAGAYADATGLGVVVVGLASGGSTQIALPGDEPSQHWDVREEDNLYARAERQARRALRVAQAAFPEQTVRLAGWLWIQGGADARRIDAGTETVEAYAAGLRRLAETIDTDWGVPLYLWQTGTDARGDTPGLQAVRQAQADADTHPSIVVTYTDAVTFPGRGWMQPDAVHWAQPGLNDAGAAGAAVVAAYRLANPPPEQSPPGSPPTQPPPSEPPPGEPPGERPPDPPVTPEIERLTVYPNPARVAPWVYAPCAFRFQVVDALGRVLQRGVGDGAVRLRPLRAGTYVLQAEPRGGAGDTCRGTRTLSIAP